jgi:hypothetical protein
MELLNLKTHGRRVHRWCMTAAALGMLAVVAVSCLSAGPGQVLPRFPHGVHTEQLNLQCTFCHVSVRSTDLPTMPPPELCAPCHDDLDRGRDSARTARSLYGDQGQLTRSRSGLLDTDVVLSHGIHVGQGKLDCALCHQDVIEDRPRPVEPPSWKSRCMDCHAERGLDNQECATCHREVDRDWLPSNHLLAWQERHGRVVRDGEEGSANRCSLCHDQASSCQACHESQPPRDHGSYFRLRGHGIQASMDRSRCDTCHRRDSCEQCHGETRPLSHRAGFGDPHNRHCTGCHFGDAERGCAVCHREMPDHDQATPLPATHSPAMNCRLCHGNGQPLPHPDGGHACTICHK